MSIKLGIKQLNFDLPENTMAPYCQVMDAHTEQVRQLANSAGTGSDKFKLAYQRLLLNLKHLNNIGSVLETSIDLRVLAIAINDSDAPDVKLNYELFAKIDHIKKHPNSFFVESVYSHYLDCYDKLYDIKSVEKWLKKSKFLRGELDHNTAQILSGEGPKWLAEGCHQHRLDFDVRVEQVGLGNYMSGRFLATAKNIYYLETLRNLKSGENHEILHEVQKPAVYESRYTENSLLGHEVLKILISKADTSQISDHWMNVIMAIAGDPRVSKRNERYIRWWSKVPNLINKVRGWLSKLDLKLFLKSLEDLSDQLGNDEFKRMYPLRKRFLEGLLEQELVTGTRLFLNHKAKLYLEKNYKKEHLPSFSSVKGDKSLIYIALSNVHVVEGTHSCKFWIYKNLADTAAVFNDEEDRFKYRDLTLGMHENMLIEQGEGCYEAIQHTKSGTWQVNAAIALKEAGVDIDASRLLTQPDYQSYKYSGYL